MNSNLPNLFNYDNYRAYLKDAYQALKLKDKKFSFRYFARIAGFNSHNFLRQVMNGECNLSEESMQKIAKAFKFNKEETQFFRNLVLFNQAKTSEEKQLCAREILRSRTYKKIHPLLDSQYQFFKHWYFSAVREVIGLPGAKDDYDWIGAHIIPAVTAVEVKKAVEEMLKLGLLKRNDEGRLVQSDALLTTPDEVSSVYVANWHKEYLKKAAESIDSIPREKRDISATTFGFSKKNMKIVKEMMQKFRRDIIELSAQHEDADILFQLNMQLFPLAELDDQEERP